MKFIGDIKELLEGINILKIGEGFADTEVEVKKSAEKLTIKGENGKYSIEYPKKHTFFRGLMILVDKIKNEETDFCVEEQESFETCGIMVDVSRNAVLKPETVKDLLRYMAKMGMNMMMLYTEDTYKMDKYPYFGYMRGAYTKEEIKDIVKYGDIFGIELIPCIETLAHLARTLRWDYAANMRDTDEILLIDDEKTYEFIEEMIKTQRECFSSKRIHIGMDEAFQVGFGEYFRQHGFVKRTTLLKRHLDRVMQITEKYGFKPMIWSDMFIRMATKNGQYYDENAVMTKEIADSIPKDLQLVYWDYYANQEKQYDDMIKLHNQTGRETVFAGGIWTWNGVSLNYDKSFITTKAGLSACKKNGVKDVISTLWGDDGAECSVYASLLGLQLYAEYNYGDSVDDEKLAKMFKVCTGLDMDTFLLLGVDTFDEKICPGHGSTASKQVLYQDVLTGLFDKNFAQLDMPSHYKKYLDGLENAKPQNELQYLFDYQKQLVKVLYEKCDIGIRLTKAYKEKDKAMLEKISQQLKAVYADIKNLHEQAADIWYKNNKPFGFEVFDYRLGGTESRVLRASKRIDEYLCGKICSIPELEEERLWYGKENDIFVHEFHIRNIMTASEINT